MNNIKKIRIYLLNQIGNCYEEGYVSSGYITLTKEKLIYGDGGNPYSRGWSKKIDIPESFKRNIQPKAIIRIQQKFIKNLMFCYKNDFEPVFKIKKDDFYADSHDQYFVTIVNEHVVVDNVVHDNGNPPQKFSWVLERHRRCMSEIISDIKLKRDKTIFR